MIPYIKRIIVEHKIPRWFEVYNYFIMFPTVFWPVIAFTSIFLFDSPRVNVDVMMLVVFLVLLYPLWLAILFRYNFVLFNRLKLLAVALPAVVTLSCCTAIVLFFMS